ncbi:hypothetical protein LSUE1_G005382 [Lachnellula suecica]|uniref:AB hydrolase-1 domain-containing protein n=1 Tax=Lachnellula suecica TaxID=602035 RepID=A0A8T9C9H9_9HELO|nr:hypothetical protein LSUE1_G005382 [Lachnellula suecica]
MVAIVEGHGAWREEEAMLLLGPSHHTLSSEDMEVLERTKWKKGREEIMYWGLSYGSVLGQTFAAMHPERVGRMVLDGVLDPDDYYSGAWLKNLQDSDMIITKFCEYCFEAGPSLCPLSTGNSGKDVEARLERIMMALKTSPLPVPSEGTRGPEVVTYGDMFLMMLTAMYFPYVAAEPFFALLADAERGDGTKIAVMKQRNLHPATLSPHCQRDGHFSEACTSGSYLSGFGAYQAISCMDYGGGSNFTKEEFSEYYKELRKQGKWISTSWARNKLSCLGFSPSAAAWRFEGPVSRVTSHPMLIIGNTHDTVTPIGNNPSLCTGRVLRTYFQTGELPENGTICDPEYKPFIGCLKKDENGDCRKRTGEEEEEEMWSAMEAITNVWP